METKIASWEELSNRRRKLIPVTTGDESEPVKHIEIGSVSAAEQRRIRELCTVTRKAKNMKRTAVTDADGNPAEPGAYYDTRSVDAERYVRLMAAGGIIAPEPPGHDLEAKAESLDQSLGFQCLTGIFNEVWRLSSLDPERVEALAGP